MFRTFRQARQPTKTHHVFVCFDASSSRFARESGFSQSQAKQQQSPSARRSSSVAPLARAHRTSLPSCFGGFKVVSTGSRTRASPNQNLHHHPRWPASAA